MNTQARRIQALLEAEIGYVEKPTNITVYAADLDAAETRAGTRIPRQGSPWCGTLQDYAAWRESGILPGTAGSAFPVRNFGTSSAARFYAEVLPRQWGQWGRPGDLAFKSMVGAGHIGFVISPDDFERLTGRALGQGRVATLEGNTSSTAVGSQTNGGEVAVKSRAFSFWAGYGTPNYTPDPIQEDDDDMAAPPFRLVRPDGYYDVAKVSSSGDTTLVRAVHDGIESPVLDGAKAGLWSQSDADAVLNPAGGTSQDISVDLWSDLTKTNPQAKR